MAIKYIDQVDLKNKNILARFDFNVPLSKKDHQLITDETRIDAALPTIKFLLEQGVARIVMMSHLGRPDGKPNPKYSLEPVAKLLAEKLNQEVLLTESCLDSGIKTLMGLKKHKIILLQNLRFHPEEENNDPAFCKTLASYGDFYVNDAFGTAHRKHASTYGVIAYFNKNSYAGGLLLKKEVEALNKIVQAPTHPFVALVGGAKVSDKIKILEKLLPEVDQLIIGGAMAYPFLKAQGNNVGRSLCQDEDVEHAKKLLTSASRSKIILPLDHIVSTSPDGAPIENHNVSIDENKMGLDIGSSTIAKYLNILSTAQTILWNGPMGLFENPDYSKGTFAIAKHLAGLKAFTLVGGGDSVSAVNMAGVADKMGHVSTGGGASLEYIENGTLPGIQALRFGVN